jgi:hypothetical protein
LKFHGKIIRIVLIILLSVVYSGQPLKAAGDPGEEKTFDPGSFIFDHIADAYDWHLFDIDGKHYSVRFL